MGCHPPEYSIDIKAETFIWHWVPVRKNTWLGEPRSSRENGLTYHHSQWPTGGLYVPHPCISRLCRIRNAGIQGGCTLSRDTTRGLLNYKLWLLHGHCKLLVFRDQQVRRGTIILSRVWTLPIQKEEVLIYPMGAGETQLMDLGTSQDSLDQLWPWTGKSCNPGLIKGSYLDQERWPLSARRIQDGSWKKGQWVPEDQLWQWGAIVCPTNFPLLSFLSGRKAHQNLGKLPLVQHKRWVVADMPMCHSDPPSREDSLCDCEDCG